MATSRFRRQNQDNIFQNNPKVVGYIRVSTEKQANEGDSLDSQREKIINHCKQNDLTLVDIYSDEGKSGTKDRTGRPGLDKLLNSLESGKALGVITPYFDRFGRGGYRTVKDVEYITKDLACRFISLDVNIDTETPTGQMMLNMMAATAKLFRDQIAEKTKDTLQSKKAKGEAYCNTPFGMKRRGHRFIKDSKEQVVINDIVELRKQGLGWLKIANDLNDRNILPKRGKKWYATSVQLIHERVTLVA